MGLMSKNFCQKQTAIAIGYKYEKLCKKIVRGKAWSEVITLQQVLSKMFLTPNVVLPVYFVINLLFTYTHRKYERTKQMAMDLKDQEAILMAEKRVLEESLKTQEQRYEKMKNHAVQQLEKWVLY